MALRRDSWLHIAQRLPIGGQCRVPHKGDRTNRDNLIVSNHGDRWSAFCMSCKEGGVLFKSHIRITDMAAPRQSTELSLPADMRPVLDLPDHLQRPVLSFLASKHMDLRQFPQGLMFSDERKRLLVPTKWGWLGRDTTGSSMQKWLTYNRSHYLGDPSSGLNVVVEDPFSFFKVRWAIRDTEYADVTVLCALGTGVRDALFAGLLSARAVAFVYDGDVAGERGAATGARRLRSLGIQSHAAPVQTGKDPKDLTAEEIRQHLGSIPWTRG